MRFTTRLLLVLFALTLPVYGLPRDAVAVLNRCGRPLKGDLTVYDNTVAGGERTLTYERGVLHFNRVENDGWTFTFGEHRKQTHLDATDMENYMPCLGDALADSAAPAPLQPVSRATRVETSVKRTYEKHILLSLILLVLAGIGLFFWAKRDRQIEEDSE